MNKYIIAAAVAGAIAAAPAAQAATVEHGDRPFYGFFLANPGGYTNALEDRYGFSVQNFNDPSTNELILGFSGGLGVYAAAAIDGVYYAAPYLYESSLSMPTPQPLMSYNIYTGMTTEIGPWSDGNTDLKPSDMTYDRKNDRLLAICYGSLEGSGIYEVNRETGAMTLLRGVPAGCGLIAADAFGRVFSINLEGQLLQIDMNSQNSSKVIYKLPYSDLSSNQSLEFDLTSGKLYWAANTLNNPLGDRGKSTWLVEITLPSISPDMNYSSGMAGYSNTEMGEIGYEARFLGMYIPYAEGGFDAPSFAVDAVSVPAADGKTCTLKFKAPSKTFGGDPLAAIDGYDIYRDGEKIYTGKGTLAAGAEATFEDKNIPVTGKEYRYDIVCYSNTKGDGPKSPVFAYIGFDAPSQVTEAKVEISDDFLGTTVTWKAPEVGLHGGTYDPSKTTYDVVRLPDNVKVSEGLTECKVTDKLRRLLRYSYRITAKNEFGSAKAETHDFVAGTPIDELPLEQTFEDPTAFHLQWNSVDNNGDALTWLYGSTLGQSMFGDYEMAAEYILSPTSVDAFTKDADDWIITPPVVFEAGKKFHVEFGIRSLTNERLNVYVGRRNTVDAMNKVATFTLNPPQHNEDGRMIFQNYEFDLPEDIAGTISCVALQLATPLPANLIGFIQVGSFIVDEGEATGVESVIAGSDATYSVSGGVLTIAGEYDNAALYGINGAKVMDIHGESTSLSGLRGLYILVIDGRSHKLAL